jgi:hypothetical protein
VCGMDPAATGLLLRLKVQVNLLTIRTQPLFLLKVCLQSPGAAVE